MSKPALHPWLDTPEAVQAARRAVRVPEYKMPAAVKAIGADELLSEAFTILTECALPPRERGHFACAQCGGELKNVRAGAKYCSPKCRNLAGVRRLRAGGTEAPPAQPKGHIGSMWSWPEDERVSYATREVGLVLCNYLRTRTGRSEVPASPSIENTNLAQDVADEGTVREVIEDYLVTCGVEYDGTETLDELVEAAKHLRGLSEPVLQVAEAA